MKFITLIGLLLASIAHSQTYDFSALVNQMAFSGSFTYYQGTMEEVNISNGFDGAAFHDGTANGNQIVFQTGNEFLSFFTGPDYVGSSSTSFTPTGLVLNTPSALYQCGNGVVNCSASLGIHSVSAQAPEICGKDLAGSLTLLGVGLFVVHSFRGKR